jgi:chemotaxis protein methyltransferase CheR
VSRHAEPGRTAAAGGELRLGAREFEQICELARRSFGLDLKPGKEGLVAARLRRLVHDGGFCCFEDYYRSLLRDTTGAALEGMIDALSTNHTSFLREPEHFEFLRQEVLPRLPARVPVEVWSAACATGEEAWTLAIVLLEALGPGGFRVSGSDVSHKALAFAGRACYPADRCEALPAGWLASHFIPEGRPVKAWRVSDAVRRAVAFRHLNLVESYFWGRRFPVIFCRNVLIYFDAPTQAHVIRQIEECLEPGGYLFVGHAESLTRMDHSLEYVRPAVYRKPASCGARGRRKEARF